MMEKLDMVDLESVCGGQITSERALAKALGHAGVREDQVQLKMLNLESERGKQVYEIEFGFNHVDYVCTLDASSGNVLKFQKNWR